MSRRYEVVVVGGGQAGLAVGHHLVRQARDFVILDASARTGDSWRTRWDSIWLFAPARCSALPGLPFPADPDHLPGRDEVARYLEGYASHFGLPLRSGERVHSIRRMQDAPGFIVESSSARYEADQVVVATGAFQKPRVPAAASELAPEVVQLHTSEYHNPSQLPPGDLLVVGGGDSGVQIAAELSAVARTRPSVGGPLPRLPERFLRRSIFWWLEKAGAMDIPAESGIGRWMRVRDSLIGQSTAMLSRDHGVELLGRVERARGDRVVTLDDREVGVAGVVWATGFRSEFGFLEASTLDERGQPRHTRGVGTTPGLYFLGLPWQSTRGSGLLGWVGRDAAYLAARITERAGRRELVAV